MERVFKQVIFGGSYAYIVRSSDYVRGCFNLVDLKDGSFVVITLLGFPRTPAKKVSVIERGVVVAPVSHMFNGSGTSDRSFEPGSLRDEPIGHVTAVAVAADGEAVGISNTIFHQSIHTGEDVFARTRNNLGHDAKKEFIA